MALGNPQKRKASLGIVWMLLALVAAAFLGAAIGLVWQNAGWFMDDDADEVVTVEQPGG